MKMSFKLREKLILITVSTILLVMGLNTYLNISDFIRVYKERVIERVFIQIEPLKKNIEDLIVLGLELADMEEIDRECLEVINRINYSLYCYVTDNQGRVYFNRSFQEKGSVYSDPVTLAALASKKRHVQVYRLDSGEKAYDFSLPIEKPNGERIGLIRFGIQYRIIDEEVSRLIRRAVTLAILSLVFAGLLVFFLSEYGILRPVRQLVEGITKFGRGELDSRVKVGTKDEIGELAKSYNNMAQSILQYITERKKTEEKLERYAVEIEQANEEIKTFAYTVSHDLRAPLVSIKGFSEEIKRTIAEGRSFLTKYVPTLSEEDKKIYSAIFEHDITEAVGFMGASVSRMDFLLESVLKLSRLGRSELKPEPVHMEQLVHSLLKTLAHQIESHRAQVTVGALPDMVIDKTAIERIFGNLLDNALKYLEPSRPGKIEIKAEQNAEEIIFTIRDNGRGIDTEDTKRVFELFRRAGKQDIPGEGMGLTYVKTLVKRLGGRIWCESELGVGTAFSFSLPVSVGEYGEPLSTGGRS
jgi:signal transduction histidine kinase